MVVNQHRKMSMRIMNIGVGLLMITMYGLVTGASTESEDMVAICSKRLNGILNPMTLFMKIVTELQRLSESNPLVQITIPGSEIKDMDALLSSHSDSSLFMQCTEEISQPPTLFSDTRTSSTRICQWKVSPYFEITINVKKVNGRASVELDVSQVNAVSREGINTFCKDVTNCPAYCPPSDAMSITGGTTDTGSTYCPPSDAMSITGGTTDTDMCLKLTGIVIACLVSFIGGGVCVLLGLFIYRSISNRRVIQASNKDEEHLGHSKSELQVVDATSTHQATQKTYESVGGSVDYGTDKTQTEHIYRGLDTSTIQSPSKPRTKKGVSHIPSVNINAAHSDVYEQTGDLKAAEDDHVYNTLDASEANFNLDLQDEHNRVTKTMDTIPSGEHHRLTEHAKHLTENDQPDADHNYFTLRKEEAGNLNENTSTHTESKQANETTTNDTSSDHAYATLERE